jgi:hypothetical protein
MKQTVIVKQTKWCLNNFIEQTPKLETTTEETKGKDGVVVKRNLNSIVAEIKANSTVKIKVKGVIKLLVR